MDASFESSRELPDRLYFRIGDAAEIVGVKPYVLRYWESEFSIISPSKSESGQRVYCKADVENLLLIKHLLYRDRYSIEGARKKMSELRKSGSLKVYRTEMLEMEVAAGRERSAREKLQIAVSELQAIAHTGIGELFKF